MHAGTVIFTHGDCDGICSGALALAASGSAAVYFSNPVSILGDLERAGGADRVIVCDIAIDRYSAAAVRKRLGLLAKKADVVYIDHHPLPPRFNVSWLLHDAGACSSQLTYARFHGSLDPDMSRVAIYGAIGDYKDKTPMTEELLKTWDRRSLYYEAGTLSQGIEAGRRDYEFKRVILGLLSRNVLPSQIDALARNAVEASRVEDELRLHVERDVRRLDNISYVVDMAGPVSKAAIYAHIYGGTCAGLAAEYLPSKNVYDISVRAKGDCGLDELVGKMAHRHGGTGGGHPQAAGGRIPAPGLMDFIKDLDASLGARM